MEDVNKYFEEGDGRLPIDKTRNNYFSALDDLREQLSLKKNKEPYSFGSFFPFSKRLATFQTWPALHSLQPIHLAQAGFCYIGEGVFVPGVR